MDSSAFFNLFSVILIIANDRKELLWNRSPCRIIIENRGVI